MDAERMNQVVAVLEKQESRYRWSALRWKIGYRLMLILSAVLSASAALVAKLSFVPEELGSDLSAILAGGAAIMTTVMAALDFESNFRLNRRSRHQMQILVIEAMKDGANPEDLLSSAQKVIDERTKELDKLD
ncbi:hypothetical protein ACFW6U_06070 [Pseudomonas guariconensis]|uniref:hypothetical protein n=2 Tax=Pseudomonas TaxID=286 RepID=UPI00366EF720|nr:hypothetical protein [Pseudomonas putida]